MRSLDCDLKQYLESQGIPCQELYGATPVERESLDDDEFIIDFRDTGVPAREDWGYMPHG